MEFIKNFLVGAAKFVYGIFVAPIVEVKDILSMDWGQKILTMLNAVSRAVIIASWFFAVPALLVTVAWVWFWLSLFLSLVYVGFVLITGGLGLALVLASIKATGDNLDNVKAEEATPVAA
jgi:hypothetical protein